MTRLIEVVTYNPDWPQQFADEAAHLETLFGDNLIAIHHIGSTAVPSLAAKPIIDLLAAVKDVRKVDFLNPLLISLGYTPRGELGMAFRRFFHKGDPTRTHHLHVFEEENPEIERHLLFRDHLRTHPKDRQAYETLKLNLAQKYPYARARYTEGKEALIQDIQYKTGFQGFHLVQTLTQSEWKAYYRIRSKPIVEGPTHYHFVFYKGVEIIGILHIELTLKAPPVIHALQIDSSYAKEEYALRKIAQKWLRYQQNKISELINVGYIAKNGKLD